MSDHAPDTPGPAPVPELQDREGPGSAPGRYTVAEAAAMLGISERAVRKRLAAGTLEGDREGGSWRVALKAGPGSGPGAAAPEPRDQAVAALREEAAALRAERDSLLEQRAFLKDQLEIRREEVERKDATIAEMASALASQADSIRALQATVVPAQLVDHLPVENRQEGHSEARQRTDPPFGDSGSSRAPRRRPWWRPW